MSLGLKEYEGIPIGESYLSSRKGLRHSNTKFLISKGLKCKIINKVNQGSPHIVEKLSSKAIDLVINTTEGAESIADSFSLRRSTLVNKIPYFTTLASANGCVEAIESLRKNTLKVKALQDI